MKWGAQRLNGGPGTTGPPAGDGHAVSHRGLRKNPLSAACPWDNVFSVIAQDS